MPTPEAPITTSLNVGMLGEESRLGVDEDSAQLGASMSEART